MAKRKRSAADSRLDDDAPTLRDVREAVAWAPLAARPLDYSAALRRAVPRGRVATCRDLVALAGGHGTMGENIACARATKRHPLAHRVVAANGRAKAEAARRLLAEGVDLTAPRRVSLAPCLADRVLRDAASGPVLVYVHGRGGLPSTYAGRREGWWSRGSLAKLGRVVLPGAPPHAADRSAWLAYDDGWTPTPSSLAAARGRVEALVRRELAGGRRVFVGGYSEGGLVGLAAALAIGGSSEGLPGVVGFVGINCAAPPPVVGAAAFPIVLYHGTADETIPREDALRGFRALDLPFRAVAVAGATHGLADDEGRLLDLGLREMLGAGPAR